MLQTLTEHWWIWLIRGVLAIIFGVAAFAQPEVTTFALLVTFGVYAIAEGILVTWAAIRGKTDSRFVYILWGVASVLAGVIAFAQPSLAWLTIIWLIAIWAVVTGLLQITASIGLRREISGEIWLILAGVLSVIAGLILFARPGLGGLTLIFVIGAYAVLFGISLIALSFRLKGLGETRLARSA